MTKYVIDKRFASSVKKSQRVLECAESFGLGLKDQEFIIYDKMEVEVNQGDVVYITGQSGSGKSLLLRELAAQMEEEGLRVKNIDAITFEDVPLIDQVGKDTNDAIRLLSLAGLNDAYLFVRKPSELSDGQKYRFRIAKMIEKNYQVWVADEFGAVLDRITAKAIAFNLQKYARKVGATLIVATTHLDLKDELGPNVYVEKYFKAKVKVEFNHGNEEAAD